MRFALVFSENENEMQSLRFIANVHCDDYVAVCIQTRADETKKSVLTLRRRKIELHLLRALIRRRNLAGCIHTTPLNARAR